MNPKNHVEIIVERISDGNEGIGSYRGKTIFIPWAVPGDRLKVEIVEDQKNYSRAKIIQILEKSAHRIVPECPYFFQCGGCQWQHIDYVAQVRFKEELLKSHLQRIGGIASPKILETIPSQNPFHYRNRIRLQVSKKGEVGFFKSSSKEIIPIEKCLIAEPALNEKIENAKQLGKQLLQKNREACHEIEIRIEDKKVVLEMDSHENASFNQIHTHQNKRLIEKVFESISLHSTHSVLELFAGNGNFTFKIADDVHSVTAVELNSAAIVSAQAKTKKLHYKNIEWIEATAFRALQSLIRSSFHFDRLLLDPPRKGAMECIEAIAQLRIPLIVYISCDPTTLARDVKVLTQLGYQHEFSQLIDMFPQTYHLESITRLVLV